MNSQENLRPFICAECGSSFKKKWNLKVHMESHSDPFECKVCHLKFKFKHKLRSHMGRHTGVIKYSCNKCPAVFGYKQMLISHMNIQHRSLSTYWYCPGCGAHFSKSEDLETHGRLCLNIKKCEDDDEDDNKSISFQDSEELVQNTNTIVTEEPLLFEDEGSKQLVKKRLITEQVRSNSEVDKDEGNACSQFSKSRQGHGNRLERDSDMVASIATIEDTEERGSRNEGSIENANSREFVNNGNYTPGNLISEECHRISQGNSEKSVYCSSDDSVLRVELHVASEAVKEIDNIHKSKNHRLSVTEAPLHSPDVSLQWQRSFNSENTVEEVANSSICNQETKSAEGLKSGMVQIPVSIVKKLLPSVSSVPETKSYELDERSDVVVDKESDRNIGQDETSSDVLVESKNHLEALVSELSENENSMLEVDGEAHEVISEGILRKHLDKSTVSTEEEAACLISVDGLQTKNKTIKSKTSESTQGNLIDPLAKINKNFKIPEVSCSTKDSSLQSDQLEHSCVSNKETPDLHIQSSNKHQRDRRTHCSNPEVATKASAKGKLLRKSSVTAASDANIDSHIVNVNRKRKREVKANWREKEKKKKILGTSTISIDEKTVSKVKDVCVTRSIALTSKNNILDPNLFISSEMRRNPIRMKELTVQELHGLCHALVKWNIRPCVVQLEKLPKDIVDAYGCLKQADNMSQINSKRPRSLKSPCKRKIRSCPSVKTNLMSSVSNESLSKKRAKTAEKLRRSPKQKKRKRPGKYQTNSSWSKRRRPSNDTLFPIEDFESTPEIAKRTRRWAHILKRAEMCLKLRKRILGLKEESKYQSSDDSENTPIENESHMEVEESIHVSEYRNHILNHYKENQEWSKGGKQATMQSPAMLLSAYLSDPEGEIKVKEEVDVTSEFLDYDY
ncbi:uncharacterized protein LOC125035110 [Penaeus chinensis]|uniref:uncharacterized protein LOC125035110 n=1 Tax=Penaeus chinensis TaxID=139456 RepID=UPI001FB62B9F|nr:uncharacterized protein LOC125035110 [Penaeus chinensis]XP_047483227.1 uncharacterized protein LOC125035110 [Penaeus chinensis]XP_047483228.1 uncharacterized protein LOC125035110 [Penaeus chinensis]XP_047483229.1 uncharacterized protein LOC125035110 [Penaeus chinensis]XP_047483230.1 uncharacterized protein LOC125035110 [Penaeus chinensis]XP_047483231.1 uncharacterized protein LOC125035110 [Penaeus chinensis]XP_047483232.1 uncharacterized protein LOC125035110 [Penaeus chinensis]